MTIGERLCTIRGKFDLSQEGAAAKYFIPLGSWKKYEIGPSEPGSGALRKLAEGGVNVNWLLTGEGEMLLTDQSSNTNETIPSQIDTKEFIEILEILQEKDFEYHALGTTYIGYFAAIIYNRIKPFDKNFWEINLKAAIFELNLILRDQDLSRLEKRITDLKNKGAGYSYPEHIEVLQDFADEHIKVLGRYRGLFGNRMLGADTQLEIDFIKGLGL